MKAHLDPERTTYVAYGLLDEREKAQVASHLSECPACLESVRRMQEERDLVVEASAPAPLPEELVRSLAARVYDRAVTIPRRRKRRLLGLACAAAGFLAIGILFLTRTRELAEAKHAVVVGRVAVQRGGAWLAQSDEYIPTPGDRIRTDDPAGASIRLEEGSTFNIYRGSMVEFRGARGPTAVLKLLEGQVNCQVVPDPRPFTVEALGTTVTVVGTEFDVHVLDDEPVFKSDEKILRRPKIGMIVHSGQVLFRNEGKEVRVHEGFVALCALKGGPWIWGETRDLSKEKLLDKLTRKLRLAKPAAEAGTPDTSWKDRSDAAVLDRVDAVPWTRLSAALVRHHHETDAAIEEERASYVAPQVKSDLEWGWFNLHALADELNVTGDFMQACRNRVAWRSFLPAMVEAMSGDPLSPEQLKRLQVPATMDNLLPVIPESAPVLEKWKLRVEGTIRFVRQLKEVLSDAEYRRVTRNVGASFMTDKFFVWVVEGADAENASDRMARIWEESFQIPWHAAVPLKVIAARHVKSHREAVSKARASTDPRSGVEELELVARLLDLQLQAERAVSEIASLNAETRARAAAGADVLFRIKIHE